MPESLPTAIEVLRDRMETLVAEELRPLEAQLPDDPRAPIPPEIVQQVRDRSRDAGMWSLTQPVEFGGAAAGALPQTAVREALAAGHLRVARYVFGPGPGMLAAAEGQLKDQYLDPVLRGEKRGSFAFTEPSGDGDHKPTWATWGRRRPAGHRSQGVRHGRQNRRLLRRADQRRGSRRLLAARRPRDARDRPRDRGRHDRS